VNFVPNLLAQQFYTFQPSLLELTSFAGLLYLALVRFAENVKLFRRGIWVSGCIWSLL